MPTSEDSVDWVPLYLVSLLLAAFLLVIAAVGQQAPAAPADPGPSSGKPAPRAIRPAPPASSAPTPAGPEVPRTLPGGAARIFTGDRVLVAYYGTAGTGSLGVLGEGSPEQIMPRLIRAAAPFARGGRPVQPVFELIATVVHGSPGKDRDFNADIPRAQVQRYIDAAHHHGALLILDLQPGRADFLSVAKRWEWALKDPWVGLALDPEWRMRPRQVPGRVIGSVAAAEVNRVSAWLEDLTVREGLPEKVFLLHQFRTSMIRGIERVRPRPHLAMVQHVDGFGPPRAKLATFRAVIRPSQFALGFKLFYDEDVPRMRPERVLRIRPRISFVSFQ
ncbi:hypothetical protein [Nocardioides marmoriginsengisoli]|uniref:hypothetical protein n=1 Tax=Nocardioides marmoriginsengisoli TaxID=661483 RepID=UPI0016154163|nr:hypothetical protein [Nocardioides marmoriginsengisoli]